VIEFQINSQINRSPAEVFALLSDVERTQSWQKSVVAVTRTTAGPTRAGSEFEATWKVMGSRRVSNRVAAYRPDELIAFAGDASFADYYCAYELASTANGGTTVVTRTEFRLHGLWKLAQPLLAGELRRETTAELAELKRLVEATMTASQPAPAN
jgi:uncharacterized protein YndB with AHSA1/START domain